MIGKVLRRLPGWIHISMGGVLRALVNSRDIPIEEAQKIRDSISAGEMVDKVIENVAKIVNFSRTWITIVIYLFQGCRKFSFR